MAHFQVERRILSRPAEVWWSGFRSTTTRLQQAGWEIAAEEELHRNAIRLMLRNQDMRLFAMTNTVEWDYYDDSLKDRPLIFQVIVAAPRLECRQVPEVGAGWANFKQIDAAPQWIETKVVTPDDLRIFATPMVRTEEIITAPQDVAALLEQIRKMQAPEQERIRAKERLRSAREGLAFEAVPRQQFHAQIISIGDYRNAA